MTKVLTVLLSLCAAVLASLEPAGYRPPSSSYLPPQQNQNYDSPSSFGAQPSPSPSSQYLPPGQNLRPSGFSSPSQQYLPPSVQSPSNFLEQPQEYKPPKEYLPPTSRPSSVPPPPPSNEYLPPHPGGRPPQKEYLPPSTTRQPPKKDYLPPTSRPVPQKPKGDYLPPRNNQDFLAKRPATVAPSRTPVSTGFQADSQNYKQTGYSGGPGLLAASSSVAPGVSDSYLPPSNYDSSSGYQYDNFGSNRLQAEQSTEPAKYNFEYRVSDEFGNDFGHKESREGSHTLGKYTVLLPDGRKQIVQYEADEEGFRPRITYEEAATVLGSKTPALRGHDGYDANSLDAHQGY